MYSWKPINDSDRNTYHVLIKSTGEIMHNELSYTNNNLQEG